jgi:tRNA-splicing ligase RtcB
MIEIPSKVPIKAWTDGVELDHGALQQLFNVSRLPVVGPHVAVMPDVHWGIGRLRDPHHEGDYPGGRGCF